MKPEEDAPRLFLPKYTKLHEDLDARVNRRVDFTAKVAADLDRTLVSLAGGALVFSMTFVEKLAPEKLCLPVLFAAWVLFAISMVSVLLGNREVQRALEADIAKAPQIADEIDAAEEEAIRTGVARTIRFRQTGLTVAKANRFNTVALSSFGLGLLALGFFVAFNLWFSRGPCVDRKVSQENAQPPIARYS